MKAVSAMLHGKGFRARRKDSSGVGNVTDNQRQLDRFEEWQNVMDWEDVDRDSLDGSNFPYHAQNQTYPEVPPIADKDAHSLYQALRNIRATPAVYNALKDDERYALDRALQSYGKTGGRRWADTTLMNIRYGLDDAAALDRDSLFTLQSMIRQQDHEIHSYFKNLERLHEEAMQEISSIKSIEAERESFAQQQRERQRVDFAVNAGFGGAAALGFFMAETSDRLSALTEGYAPSNTLQLTGHLMTMVSGVCLGFYAWKQRRKEGMPQAALVDSDENEGRK